MTNTTHIKLVGPTGTGKSIAAKALLLPRVKYGHQVVVFDPHAAPNTWNGIRAYGAGLNYKEAEWEMARLIGVLHRRYQAVANGVESFRPITIVLDECPALAANTTIFRKFVATLSREGRKVAMYLIILTQTTRVRSLAIIGEGDILENFATITLIAPGEDAKFETDDTCEWIPTRDWLEASKMWKVEPKRKRSGCWLNAMILLIPVAIYLGGLGYLWLWSN